MVHGVPAYTGTFWTDTLGRVEWTHGGCFEWTPHNTTTTDRTDTDTHRTHAHAGHTRTHAQKTQHAGPKQVKKSNDFSDKKSMFFFDAPEKCHLHKVTFSKCPCPVGPRGRARPVRHGRTIRPENACRAFDGDIHSRIFILRVEPSSVRKDILHIPQYQPNFRHLSSTAAVSTQNLDLPGFPPHPGFPGSARVTPLCRVNLK